MKRSHTGPNASPFLRRKKQRAITRKKERGAPYAHDRLQRLNLSRYMLRGLGVLPMIFVPGLWGG